MTDGSPERQQVGRDGVEPLEPSAVGQFVKRGRCDRFIHQSVNGDDEAAARPWKEAFGVMNLALVGYGRETEARQVEAFAADATRVIGPDLDPAAPVAPDITVDETWHRSANGQREQLSRAIADAAALPTDEYILLYQTPLRGEIGAFSLAGEADVIALSPVDIPRETGGSADSDEAAAVEARILECKSATDEHAAHRVQVAIYAELLDQVLTARSDGPSVHITTGVQNDDPAFRSGTIRSPFDVSTFDLDAWRVSTHTLLAAGGPVDTALGANLDELAYSVDNRCTNCMFAEACLTRAAEAVEGPESLSLLGLSPATQARLRDAGLTSITDLAELSARPDHPHPTDDPPALTATSDQAAVLDERSDGASHRLVQRAQAARAETDPDTATFASPPPLQGEDWVPLPRDSVAGWGNLEETPTGHLIQVPIVVRPDPAIDRIAGFGATVTAAASDLQLTIGETIATLPDDPADRDRAERDLFERAIPKLFDAIERVAADLGDPTEAVCHAYLFSPQAETALAEGLDRHRDYSPARALRSLTSLRDDGVTEPDQAMVSVVQPILSNAFALPHPNLGLLPLVEAFTGHLPSLLFEDLPGSSTTFLDAFGYKYMQYWVSYRNADGHIRLQTEPRNDDTPVDGQYPARKREGAMVPIEYFWSVLPRAAGDESPRLTLAQLDDGTLDDETNTLYEREIARFRRRDRNRDTTLRRDDLDALLAGLSRTLLDLLHAVPDRYKDAYLDKHTLDATALGTLDILDQSTPSAARDVLRFEHAARREDITALYRRPLRDRVRTGRSLPIRCTDWAETPDGALQIEAAFLHDALFDPEQAELVNRHLRIHGSDGPESGSWLVLTPLTRTSDSTPTYQDTDLPDPAARKHSPPVLVEAIDPTAGTITLRTLPRRLTKQYSPFRVEHTGWVAPGISNVEDTERSDRLVDGREPVPVETGMAYCLDPMVDDLTAGKADAALRPETVSSNALWDHLSLAKTTGITPYADVGRPADVNAFLERIEDMETTLTPNADQRRFITDVTRSVVTLQGPPGTGKTSGAIAPAILSRAYATTRSDRPFFGVALAPSHQAVETVLAETAARLDEYRSGGETDLLDTISLYRVQPQVSSPGERADDGLDHVAVQYLSYFDDDDEDVLGTLGATLTDPSRQNGQPPATILFVTPSTLYKVLGIVAAHATAIDGTTAGAAMRYSGLADLLVVDEASMLSLPKLLLGGAALKPAGQTLLVGDRRQLATVTAHDWDDDDRAPIDDTKAHLSALDYVNWLASRAPAPDSLHPLTTESFSIQTGGTDD